MTSMSDDRLKELEQRIDELNRKCTQVLMFLSFAIAAGVLIWSNSALGGVRKALVVDGVERWIWAVFPILAGILPVKDFSNNNVRWYNFLRWLKFVLLWLALVLVCWGAVDVARAFRI